MPPSKKVLFRCLYDDPAEHHLTSQKFILGSIAMVLGENKCWLEL